MQRLSNHVIHRLASKCRLAALLVIALSNGSVLRPAAAEPTTRPDAVRVRGHVVRPDGKPAAGARVVIGAAYGHTHTRHALASTTAAADGAFELEFDKADFTSDNSTDRRKDFWKAAQVIAVADGFGMAWAHLDQADAAGDLVLPLAVDDLPVQGRLVDDAGRPLAGIELSVAEVSRFADPADLAAEFRKPGALAKALRIWRPLAAAGVERPLRTDADGRFRLDGVGHGRRVVLGLAGPTIAHVFIAAATRETAPETEWVTFPEFGSKSYARPTYAATFEHKAVVGGSAEGTVRDAATGQPVAGVTVQDARFPVAFSDMGGIGLLRTTTDAQGHYRLDGFPPGDGSRVLVSSPDGPPYFSRKVDLSNKAGALSADVELHRGVRVTGRVTDKATGRPVPGANVAYNTYRDNPAIKGLPEFRPPKNPMGDPRGDFEGEIEGSECCTGPDGTYRFVVAPGKAIIGAHVYGDEYRRGIGFDAMLVYKRRNYRSLLVSSYPAPAVWNVGREIDVPVGDAGVTCDLVLDPGQSIRINVVGPDGQPAAGPLVAQGRTTERSIDGIYDPVSASFDAIGFKPDEKRQIVVIDPTHKLGFAFKVDAGAQGDFPLDVVLEPTAEVVGRLLDAGGKPMANVRVSADSVWSVLRIAMATTDADGRFGLTLPAGALVDLTTRDASDDGQPVSGPAALDIKPGERIDLHDVTLPPRRRR